MFSVLVLFAWRMNGGWNILHHNFGIRYGMYFTLNFARKLFFHDQFCLASLLPSLCCKTGTSVFQDAIGMAKTEVEEREMYGMLLDAVRFAIM